MLKKYFLTNLQGFDLHIAGEGGGGVYCKSCFVSFVEAANNIL